MKYVIAGATKEQNIETIKSMNDLIDSGECDEDGKKLLRMTIDVLEERNKKLDEINKCDELGCKNGKIRTYGKGAYGWIYCGKCHPEKKYNSNQLKKKQT